MWKTNIPFVNKNFIPNKRFIILIFGIIITSTISGIFLSLGVGITQTNYLSNSNNDVLVLLEPNVRSPTVSKVPKVITNVFNQTNGVELISPENLDIVVYNNNLITLHGITQNFLFFSNNKIIEGLGLTALFSSNETSAILGKNVAAQYNLKIGEKYLLYSSLSENYVALNVKGIVEFRSTFDNEIFTSLEVSEFFRGNAYPDHYSLIQIKFDQNLITRENLDELISRRYEIKIFPVLNQNLTEILVDIRVDIFSLDGTLIYNRTTNEQGFVQNSLFIGDYIVYVTYKENLFRKRISVTKNSDEIIPINYTSFNLFIKTYNEGIEIKNASLSVISDFGYHFSSENKSDIQLFDLKSGKYHISSNYSDQFIETPLYLSEDNYQTRNVSLILNFSLPIQLNVFSPQGQVIDQYEITIYDNNTLIKHELIIEDNYIFYLPKGNFLLILESIDFGSLNKTFSVHSQGSIQIEYAYLGNTTNTLVFSDQFGIPLINSNVEKRKLGSSDFEPLGITDTNGELVLTESSGTKLEIRIHQNSENATFYYTPIIDERTTITIPDFKKFLINVSIPNSGFVEGVENANVSIKSSDGSIIQTTTNSSGLSEINFFGEQILEITINASNQAKTVVVSSKGVNQTNIFIGNTTVVLRIGTNSKNILSNTRISIYDLETNLSLNVNNENKLILNLKTLTQNDDFFNKFEKKIYNEIEIYSIPSYRHLLGLDQNNSDGFFFDHFYKLDFTWKNWNKSFFIPKTYFSTLFYLDISLPSYFVLDLQLVDFLGKPIGNAKAELYSNDQINNFTLFKISDTTGHFIFNQLTPGEYKINYFIEEYSFSVNVFIDETKELKVELPIIIDFSKSKNLNYNLKFYSSSLYNEQFLGLSFGFISNIFVILLIIVSVIIIFYMNSIIDYIFIESRKEFSILSMIGASKVIIMLNFTFRVQKFIVISTLFGLIFGSYTATIYAFFIKIYIVGYTIIPVFSLESILFGFILMNLIFFFFLIMKAFKFINSSLYSLSTIRVD